MAGYALRSVPNCRPVASLPIKVSTATATSTGTNRRGQRERIAVRHGQMFLDRQVEGGQQIAELIRHAWVEPADRVGRELGEVGRDDTQAPWTKSCIRNAPRHSIAALCEYANSGTIGRPITAQKAIV